MVSRYRDRNPAGEFFAMPMRSSRTRFERAVRRRWNGAIGSAEFFERRGTAEFRRSAPAVRSQRRSEDRRRRQPTGCWEIVAREQPVGRPRYDPGVSFPSHVLLLTRARRSQQPRRAVSFPGGKIDATDASPLDAALREAWEEVGLSHEFVEPVGYLDLYGTAFGFASCEPNCQSKAGLYAEDQ